MLAEANKSRQQMEAEFLEAHRSQMRLQAILDMIRSGRNGNKCIHRAVGDT